MGKLNADDKRKLLQTMLLSRSGDLREQSLIRQGKGWFHVSGMGHEALAVAGYLLREGDYFSGYYRDRPIALARGMENYDLALAFFAKRASASGGRQMPAHFSSKELGILSIASVVGSSLLPAAGLAWALKLDNKPNLVLTTVGDAGSRQGDFFESIAFAIERQLPVIFLVEDNGIGISTVTEKMHPLGLDMLNGKMWKIADGCCVDAVYDVVQPAMEAARAGKGPQFIWCQTERISSHSSADDHRKYRSEEELESLDGKDPINRLKRDMIASGDLSEEAFEEMKASIEKDVRSEYQRAFEDHDPTPEDLMKHVLGPTSKAPSLKLDLKGEQARMVDAINATFHAALKKSREVVFFGQDIEDPKGGVFSLTKGLSTRAPEQVFNSPLAESTIFGVAAGMAAYGKRPVFEIQFADYIWPGFNQLVTQLSTLHWRTNGEWSAPAVIYAPYGAYLPGGALWHSQTNESALAHFPGLKIAVPSTPEDAAGLFWTAMHGNSPSLILLPKHLMWTTHEPNGNFQPVPFGKAVIRQEGTSLTLVTWGNGTEVVQEALELLGDTDRIEVIDLRTVSPIDMATIEASVEKTGRILIVQEDAESCSIGQNIISRLTANGEIFSRLQAPPTLLAKPDVNIGYNPVLEYAALPGKKDVARKIQELLTLEWARQEPQKAALPVANPAFEQLKESLAGEHAGQAKELTGIKVPILGEGITTARVISLIAKPGDEIEPDDALCEVETDKALFPIESPYSGRFVDWKVREDDEVGVGQVIAEMEVPTEERPAPQSSLESTTQRESTSTLEDAGQPATDKIIEGGLPHRVIAQLKNVVPAHMTVKAGWETIREARKAAKKELGKAAPSPTVMVAWALVQAMKRHPVFSCTITQDNTLSHNKIFDFGVAVALKKDALDTAIIPRASELEGPAFVEAYAGAIEAVREGNTRSKAGVPLILTSMGGFDVRDAQPLVVPPAIATLFLGEAHWESKDTKSFIQQVALCLSFDHRWLNGAAGAHFLQDVKKEMESFSLDVLKG
ncbi:thiamine pyrophosphate-dependent enzyme [Oceanipulchritudo coccoides]|nr:thiamine pyrophosphate-dependent enzyme [Oceanipulchritudo coccoides]